MKPIKVYAGYNMNQDVRLSSSSGAIFSLLAENVLSQKGTVYGVKMSDDCYSAEFTRVTDIAGLVWLRGSKYLQAKVGNTYKQVKADLLADKLVLFSGTGCQVNGLKNFLGKEYDNLLCVDVICHGAPSPALWKKYAEQQEERNGGKLKGINFRCKDDSWTDFGMKEVLEEIPRGEEKQVYISKDKSCMAGFVLKNTLSDNGGVTRGICKMDENGNLTEVVETKNIIKTVTGAEADGVVVDVNSLVSMNMWGLTPEFLDVLEQGFKEFFEKAVPENPLKAEYLIPIFIGELLEQGKMSVKVLKTNDTWYGMTYHEDVVAVKDSFKKMLEVGIYKVDLFSDL